jgi:hypothetical protein
MKLHRIGAAEQAFSVISERGPIPRAPMARPNASSKPAYANGRCSALRVLRRADRIAPALVANFNTTRTHNGIKHMTPFAKLNNLLGSDT